MDYFLRCCAGENTSSEAAAAGLTGSLLKQGCLVESCVLKKSHGTKRYSADTLGGTQGVLSGSSWVLQLLISSITDDGMLKKYSGAPARCSQYRYS